MKRNVFLVISAVLAIIFGLTMLFAPGQMIDSMIIAADPSAPRVLQYSGGMMLGIGTINFLSRNDTGSASLRAVMIGNIVLQVAGLAVDAYHYSIGFINTSGIGMGTVVHSLLIIGFVYYLRKMGRNG